MSEGERIMLADAYREVKLSVSKATGSRRATFVLTDNQIHNATNGASKEKKRWLHKKKSTRRRIKNRDEPQMIAIMQEVKA